ncbi:MAG: hypothetical protein AAB403_11315 [Planctomycetota bacterium]
MNIDSAPEHARRIAASPADRIANTINDGGDPAESLFSAFSGATGEGMV